MAEADPSAQLERLELWAGAMLASLAPAERRRLTRAVAGDLRRRNQGRMRAQIGPEGVAWAPRKPRGGNRTVGARAGAGAVRFRYDSPKSGVREVAMTSWRDEGPTMLGFDRETGALRRFRKARIVEVLDDPTGALEAGKNGRGKAAKRSQLRQRKMMVKLARKLGVRSTAGEIEVGFTAHISKVAKVHHFGLMDQVQRGQENPTARYPARELIGFPDADRQALMTALLAHLGPPPA